MKQLLITATINYRNHKWGDILVIMSTAKPIGNWYGNDKILKVLSKAFNWNLTLKICFYAYASYLKKYDSKLSSG